MNFKFHHKIKFDNTLKFADTSDVRPKFADGLPH